MTVLAGLDVADPPELWRELGFALVGETSWVSGVRHQLGVPGQGVVGWGLLPDPGLTELPTSATNHPAAPTTAHPNGVIALDHVVIATPHLARTVAALVAAGLPLRRTREAGTPERPMSQSFFKVGEIVIEVIGDPAATGSGPARFWGLTYTVDDLDATAAFLGDRLRPIKTAVQRGRRIATLDHAAGSTVPMAFMSARE